MRTATSLAEIAKRNLAGRTRQEVTFRHGGQVLRTDIGRDLLAAASQDLVDRTMAIVERLLGTVGPGVRIDDVVLVGGSSRLPAVGEAVTARFGKPPLLVDPELAVALGAALRAERLTAGAVASGREQAVAVLPRGVGVLVRDSNDPAGLREFVHHVLAPNTALPATATTPFATILDDQSTVRIQVFEQAGAVLSEELSHNRRVLDGEFDGLPGRRAGSRLDVTVSVGLDGRLTVSGEGPGRTTLRLEAYVEGVVDGADAARLTARTAAMTVRQ